MLSPSRPNLRHIYSTKSVLSCDEGDRLSITLYKVFFDEKNGMREWNLFGEKERRKLCEKNALWIKSSYIEQGRRTKTICLWLARLLLTCTHTDITYKVTNITLVKNITTHAHIRTSHTNKHNSYPCYLERKEIQLWNGKLNLIRWNDYNIYTTWARDSRHHYWLIWPFHIYILHAPSRWR